MASIAKEIVLVTGANSGIGFEIVHQLLARGGYHVYLGARSSQKGTAALQDLQSRNLTGTVDYMSLDVQSDADIASAASQITSDHGKLDILINNAAVAMAPNISERDALQMCFDVNATGPWLLSKAMIPLLRKSSNPRIINISSGAGSIGRRLFPDSPMYKIQGVQYRASKAAFNMLTACLHVEHGLGIEQTDGEKLADGVERRKMKVFAYDPGFTVSNLGPYNKKEFGARSAEDTVKSIMEVVVGKRDAEVGQFIHNDGGYPW